MMMGLDTKILKLWPNFIDHYTKLMIKLKLESCQVPQHSYKRGGNEHLEIPNRLDRQFDVVER